MTSTAADRRRVRCASALGAVAGLVPFLLVLWDLRIDPLRTAGAHGFASGFYDVQARVLLDGDLAVPRASLGIEGFVVDGRTYMYFPPFPALVRIPVLIVTDSLDGRLSAVMLLLAWIVLAAATAALFWGVRRLLRPGDSVSRIELAAGALLVATVTGGSVVVFDASLPWVYHEVYVWSVGLTVATLAAVVSFAADPRPRAVLAAVACAMATILTRTTAGWAMAFTLAAAGIVALTRTGWPRRYGTGLIAGAIATLTVGVAVNWAKFRHPYMFPLEAQVWSDVNVHRRLALRINGGTITGPQFFTTSVVNYFRPDGIRFVPYFPFVTLPAGPAPPYGGAFVDQSYRTGSVTAMMPLLSVGTLWGLVALCAIRPRRTTLWLAVVFAGAAAVGGGVLFYGYLANRYTNEFLPVLVVGSTIAFVDVARRLERRGRAVRRASLAGAAVLALFGAYANAAAGFAMARTTWKGERLAEYVSLQVSVGDVIGREAGRLVRQSAGLPATGRTDELRIVGDCEALFVGTGDQYEPWAMAEGIDRTVVIDVDPAGTSAGVARLFAVEGLATRNVTLETSDDDRIRLRIGEGLLYLPTPWLDVTPGERIEVSLVPEPTRDRYRLTVGDTPAEYLPMVETDGQGFKTVAAAAFDLPPAAAQERLGVTLTARLGEPLALCHRLLAAAAG